MKTRDQLQLIGQRDRRSHNSWMHNNPRIKQPSTHQAIMHPADANKRGIANEDEIEVSSAQGRITLHVQVSDTIAQGVIAVPHGWGHQGSQLNRAGSLPGSNINQVIPGGSENMEPASGQAIMTGHLVDVEKVTRQPPLAEESAQAVEVS